MIQLMYEINTMYTGDGDDDTIDGGLSKYVNINLLHMNETEHFTIPVFLIYFSKKSTSLLLHGILSICQFEIEIDLLTHGSITECLRYCRLIGEHEDE